MADLTFTRDQPASSELTFTRDQPKAGSPPAQQSPTPVVDRRLVPPRPAAIAADLLGIGTPILNFLDYPFRAGAADIAGMTHGAVPVTSDRREKFYETRGKALAATESPETSAEQTVSRALQLPGEAVGWAAHGLSNWMLGPEKTAAIGPAAIIAGDVASILGPAKGAAAAGERMTAGVNVAATDQFIRDTFTKAVRPSVSGKGTASLIGKYDDHIASAIHSIVENKDNLKYELGDAVSDARLPESLGELLQAVDQTKRVEFERYDALQRLSGERGASVSLESVSRELDGIANDITLINQRPDVANFAATQAETYRRQGSYTPGEAQRAIAHYNSSLQAFYKNPTSDTAHRAGIEGRIVSAMRRELDGAIENSVGSGYQAMKNRYGALRAIEKDVAHRVVVENRKVTGGGVIDHLSNIFAGEEVARGILTLNPTAIARGAILKGATAYWRYRNSPNRAVRRMFQAAERVAPQRSAGMSYSVSPGQMQPPRPGGPGQKLSGHPAETPQQRLTRTGGTEGGNPPPPPAGQTGGMQPSRPAGPSQDFRGTQGGGQIIGGGEAERIIGRREPEKPPREDPFLIPLGGGRKE